MSKPPLFVGSKTLVKDIKAKASGDEWQVGKNISSREACPATDTYSSCQGGLSALGTAYLVPCQGGLGSWVMCRTVVAGPEPRPSAQLKLIIGSLQKSALGVVEWKLNQLVI